MQRVPVRIALPTKEPLARLLRPGLSVTVTVDTREKGDAVAADGIVGAAEAKPAAAPPEAPPPPRRRNRDDLGADGAAPGGCGAPVRPAPRAPAAPAKPGDIAAGATAAARQRTDACATGSACSPWSFGLFMAIMDVQIVTSSLTQIQGGLSASPDEISWVQTAYLIADVVMVPLSGTLSRLLSTRVLFCQRRARLYRGERAVRHRDQPRADDPLPRAAGVLRRRDDADACFRSSTPSSARRSWRRSWC